VIALFVGVLLIFSLPVLPTPDAKFLPELKDQHRKLVEAVEADDVATATQQMRAMFEQSRRWIAGIEASIEKRRLWDASA
jgi:DNA-binding FadR family transcriptional regulator